MLSVVHQQSVWVLNLGGRWRNVSTGNVRSMPAGVAWEGWAMNPYGDTDQKVEDAIVILAAGRMELVELADVLEVTAEETDRILSAIKDMGLPLRSEKKGREVRYWIERTYPLSL